jgi:2-C-methyl-D-erythritol 4-phosphate cytidylyltransferase
VVDRADLVMVQTPQAFRAGALRAAHDATAPEGTDDASLVEANGGRVVLAIGHPTNLKITYPTDLLVAEALLPGVVFDDMPDGPDR